MHNNPLLQVVYRDGTGYGAGSTGTGCSTKFSFLFFIIHLKIIFNIFRWSNIMGKMRMLSVGASV